MQGLHGVYAMLRSSGQRSSPSGYNAHTVTARVIAFLSLACVALGFSCGGPDDRGQTPTVRAIIGGSVAATCQWPTAVMVNPIGCSGTLVHRRAVVTAKHCLVDELGNPSPPTSVGIGEAASRFAKTVAIAKCYGHPTDDFAICTLAEDVSEIPIVPVMAPCEMTLLTKGAAIVEVGFGASAASNPSYGTKKWIAGTLSDDATNASDIAVTAGSQDGEYYGDSGGPLYFRMPDGTWRLVGEDCCSDDIVSGSTAPRISTYTSVPFHVAWAEQQTGLDLTPCHDARGWVGGDGCVGFPTDPNRSGGSWSSMCQGQSLLLAATCEGSSQDAGAGGSGGMGIDASLGTGGAETGGMYDARAWDVSESAERPWDDAADDGSIDSTHELEAGTVAGGTGGAVGGQAGSSSGQAGTSGGQAGTSGAVASGGAVGSGGATSATGSGGIAMGGTMDVGSGGMSSTGGASALGGQTTHPDGGKDTAVGGSGGGTATSGCSCHLPRAGRRLSTPDILFALGLLMVAVLRRKGPHRG